MLVRHGADVNARDADGATPLDAAFEQGHATLAARLAAAATIERRRWLMCARQWLFVRERLAAMDGVYRTGRRLCYGCAQARPLRAPGARTCPGRCGDPALRAPAPDAEYPATHEVWYCSGACAAAAAPAHARVCTQGLRWAAAAAAAAAGEAAPVAARTREYSRGQKRPRD